MAVIHDHRLRLRRDAAVVRRLHLLRVGRALLRTSVWAALGFVVARLALALSGGRI